MAIKESIRHDAAKAAALVAIQAAVERSADAAEADVVTRALTLTVSENTSAADDVITVDIEQLPAATDTWVAEIFGPTNAVAGAAYTVAETGDGTEVVGTGTDRLTFTLSAGGAAQLTVTQDTSANASAYLVLTPVGSAGITYHETLTYVLNA